MAFTKDELDYLNDYLKDDQLVLDLIKYEDARQYVIDRIYDICKLSVDHENAVRDILGVAIYDYIMRNVSDECKKNTT